MRFYCGHGYTLQHCRNSTKVMCEISFLSIVVIVVFSVTEKNKS